ncbi:hypothetical protein BJP08_02860 [Corynebacterium sp. NML140438]|uniref:hypothetical protein n=1 Tax=Corynebacterium sp. NML140438 TaxID=1906334 RepID=UPI0008FAF9EE|nr:hypothetical protein [Corynebacterium sp. NML140438]OIR43065.1 hypothetical protein BJP08_02860 [Corynebacterium sp. NML140438]
MKKITATALATAMVASMLAPTADAASNTMSTKNYQNHCTLKFDSPGMTQNNGTYTQSAIKNWVSKQDGLKKLADTDLTNAQQSSQLSEAFGSSDAAETAALNDGMALQACLQGKDFKAEPMDDGTKAGIIIGFVLGILGLLGGLAQQAGLLR